MTVPFMYNFRSLPNKFFEMFWSLILSHFTSQGRPFFLGKKETQNFRIQKCDGESRNQKMSHFVIRHIASDIFGKVILKPL